MFTGGSGNGGQTTVFNNVSPDSLPAWATSSTNNFASGDYFFTNTGNTAALNTFTLTISGFTPGNVFSLDLLASRIDGSNPGGLYEYSLNGGTNWSGFSVLNSNGSLTLTDGWATANTQTKAFNNKTQGFDVHRYMNVNGVVLTGSTLQVRLTDSNLNDASITNSYSVLNAMQLIVVPEPATAGLLGLSLGMLLLRTTGGGRGGARLQSGVGTKRKRPSVILAESAAFVDER